MGLIFISHDLKLVSQLLRPRAGHVCRAQVVEELPRGRARRRAGTPTPAACSPRMPHIGGDRAPLPVLRREASWQRPLAEAP